VPRGIKRNPVADAITLINLGFDKISENWPYHEAILNHFPDGMTVGDIRSVMSTRDMYKERLTSVLTSAGVLPSVEAIQTRKKVKVAKKAAKKKRKAANPLKNQPQSAGDEGMRPRRVKKAKKAAVKKKAKAAKKRGPYKKRKTAVKAAATPAAE
jgi:hypothetical protein